MINPTEKKLILNFIKVHKTGAIATVSPDGKPESAAMGFSETDNLELIFQTPNTTRKYRNLKHNAYVAIIIGSDLDECITVQYEGIAKEATIDQIDMCRKVHCAKSNIAAQYAYSPENKYFIVTPKWIKYSNLKLTPPQIITISY